VVDTAPLDLDEITAEFVRAHEERLGGGAVALRRPLDLSAAGEQMRRLDALTIPYTLTPGVPAFAAGGGGSGAS
jgi:precorrin-4/cobalt-precorrin-4 C11-methyltransferase